MRAGMPCQGAAQGVVVPLPPYSVRGGSGPRADPPAYSGKEEAFHRPCSYDRSSPGRRENLAVPTGTALAREVLLYAEKKMHDPVCVRQAAPLAPGLAPYIHEHKVLVPARAQPVPAFAHPQAFVLPEALLALVARRKRAYSARKK